MFSILLVLWLRFPIAVQGIPVQNRLTNSFRVYPMAASPTTCIFYAGANLTLNSATLEKHRISAYLVTTATDVALVVSDGLGSFTLTQGPQIQENQHWRKVVRFSGNYSYAFWIYCFEDTSLLKMVGVQIYKNMAGRVEVSYDSAGYTSIGNVGIDWSNDTEIISRWESRIAVTPGDYNVKNIIATKFSCPTPVPTTTTNPSSVPTLSPTSSPQTSGDKLPQGMSLWLRADDLVGSNGSRVASWEDASGNGRVLSSSGDPNFDPILLRNRINGHNTVSFIHHSYLQGLGFKDDPPYSPFISTSGATMIAVAHDIQNDGTRSWFGGEGTWTPKGLEVNDIRNHKFEVYSGTSYGGSTTVCNPGSQDSLFTFAFRISLSNRTQDLFRCGVKFTSGTSISALNSTTLGPAYFTLGAQSKRQDLTPTRFMKSMTPELIIYNRTLRDSEMATVHSYLKAKYSACITSSPSITPTQSPTNGPSNAPSFNPSTTPTSSPTSSPILGTQAPSNAPSFNPSTTPTSSPILGTQAPSNAPSFNPSTTPTSSPTSSPIPRSATPSQTPSMMPSGMPETDAPSQSPTSLHPATIAPTMMRPLLLSEARFSNTFTRIELRFSEPTNMPQLSCADLFPNSTLARLGDTPNCVWSEATCLGIDLGTGYTVGLHGNVSIRGNIIHHQRSDAYLIATSTLVLAPLSPKLPQAVLSGPQSIGGCESLVLTSEASTGSLGHPFTYEWHYVPSLSLPSPSLELRANLSLLLGNFSKAARISILPTVLPPGTHTFTVRVINWVNLSSNATWTVVKYASSKAVPVVSFPLGDVLTVSRTESVAIPVEILPPACEQHTRGVGQMKARVHWFQIGAGDGTTVEFVPNRKLLRIPSNTLSMGETYYFMARARSVRRSGQIVAEVNATVTVHVEVEDLRAFIEGGSEITIPVLPAEPTLILISGEKSNDPSGARLLFAWTFSDVATGSAINLQGTNMSQSVLRLNTTLLSPNRIYNATLKVVSSIPLGQNFSSSVPERTDVANQLIRTVSSKIPTIYTTIIDFASSDREAAPPLTAKRVTRVRAESKLGLKATVSNFDREELSFSWECTSENLNLSALASSNQGNDVGKKLLTSTRNSALVLAPSTLETGAEYSFVVRVESRALGTVSTSSISIRTNRPPALGSCTSVPSSGFALQTEFRLQCLGWMDDDLPLTYEFLQHENSSDTYIGLMLKGATPYVTTLLPGPSEGESGMINLVARISDSLDSKVDFGFSTEVTTDTVNISTVQEQIDAALSDGDVLTLAPLIKGSIGYTRSSVVPTGGDAVSTRAKAAVVSNLINSLDNIVLSEFVNEEISILTPIELLSTVTAFGDPCELTNTSRQLAANIVTNLTLSSHNTFVSRGVQSSAKVIGNLFASMSCTDDGYDGEAAAKDITSQATEAFFEMGTGMLLSLEAGEDAAEVVESGMMMTVKMLSTSTASDSSSLTVLSSSTGIEVDVSNASFSAETAGVTMISSSSQFWLPSNRSSSWSLITPSITISITDLNTTAESPASGNQTDSPIRISFPVQSLSAKPALFRQRFSDNSPSGADTDLQLLTSSDNSSQELVCSCWVWNETASVWEEATTGTTSVGAITCDVDSVGSYDATYKWAPSVNINTFSASDVKLEAFAFDQPISVLCFIVAVLYLGLGVKACIKDTKNAGDSMHSWKQHSAHFRHIRQRMTEEFWRMENMAVEQRLHSDRSFGSWRKMMRWKFQTSNAWFSPFFHHPGDFLTSFKRLTVLLVLVFSGTAVCSLLEGQTQSLPLLGGRFSRAIVGMLFAFPVPYVASRLFARLKPKDFEVEFQTESLRCGGLLLFASLLLESSGSDGFSFLSSFAGAAIGQGLGSKAVKSLTLRLRVKFSRLRFYMLEMSQREQFGFYFRFALARYFHVPENTVNIITIDDGRDDADRASPTSSLVSGSSSVLGDTVTCKILLYDKSTTRERIKDLVAEEVFGYHPTFKRLYGAPSIQSSKIDYSFRSIDFFDTHRKHARSPEEGLQTINETIRSQSYSKLRRTPSSVVNDSKLDASTPSYCPVNKSTICTEPQGGACVARSLEAIGEMRNCTENLPGRSLDSRRDQGSMALGSRYRRRPDIPSPSPKVRKSSASTMKSAEGQPAFSTSSIDRRDFQDDDTSDLAVRFDVIEEGKGGAGSSSLLLSGPELEDGDNLTLSSSDYAGIVFCVLTSLGCWFIICVLAYQSDNRTFGWVQSTALQMFSDVFTRSTRTVLLELLFFAPICIGLSAGVYSIEKDLPRGGRGRFSFVQLSKTLKDFHYSKIHTALAHHRRNLRRVRFKSGRMGMIFDYQNVVSFVVPGSQADDKGVRAGWRILAIEGDVIGDYNHLAFVLKHYNSVLPEISIYFEGGVEEENKGDNSALCEEKCKTVMFRPGKIGLVFESDTRITAVEKNSPAFIQGVKAGWEVQAVNGERVKNVRHMAGFLSECSKNGEIVWITFIENNPSSRPLNSRSVVKRQRKQQHLLDADRETKIHKGRASFHWKDLDLKELGKKQLYASRFSYPTNLNLNVEV